MTGYDETIEVYRDNETFSSCNSVIGPFATFPVPLEGDDVSDIVDRYRDQLPMHEHMVTMDPPDHTRERALLMRLITPKRLKDNEEFIWRLADEQLDEFLGDGRCEFISAYTQPFAMLVVADLLGVPEEDHQRFREGFGLSGTAGRGRRRRGGQPGREPAGLARRVVRRVHRGPAAPAPPGRAHRPGAGHLPRRHDAGGHLGGADSTFLFAAGQETSARLLAAALKHLAEHPELQDELRADRDRIPDFLEEVLRVESPVKADFRLARRTTSIGGVEIAAGTPVMLLNGAANRDPRHFECPAEFRVDRPNAQSHVAFGRGAHSCPGGPLARAEGRVSIERILDRTRNIRLSEEHHGPPGARRFRYEPTWILRGLSKLHLEFDAAEAGRVSRVAVVTGGASGIGLGVARGFVADGHRVAIVDSQRRRRPRPRPRSCSSEGATALAVEVDVADRASVDAGFDRIRAELGPVEILVTSAGIESFTPVLDITAEGWDRIIGVNLTGTFTCVQAALPDMLDAGWGRIVTISSSSAQSGAPNMAHYAASKGGVIGLTKALAVELARSGITVNTIPPSLVDTPMARKAEAAGDFPGVDVVGPMVPLGRAGTPADIAAACSFLCSDGGSYITGQVIGVNGGMYI